MDTTAEVLAAQLREPTGTHFLDSGGVMQPDGTFRVWSTWMMTAGGIARSAGACWGCGGKGQHGAEEPDEVLATLVTGARQSGENLPRSLATLGVAAGELGPFRLAASPRFYPGFVRMVARRKPT